MKRLFKRFIIEGNGDGFNTDAELTVAFSAWLAALWNSTGPAPRQTGRNFTEKGTRVIPFGNKVNKFMVRKWIEQYGV